MLEKVKQALRISTSNTAFNTEITDLIEAAKADLVLSGILLTKVSDETDPLITRAIISYCKANFGYGNPDSEKLSNSYDLLKMHLSMSVEYIQEGF